jgi:hypothetical protein
VNRSFLYIGQLNITLNHLPAKNSNAASLTMMMQGLSITGMILSLAKEWPSIAEMYSGPPALVSPCVYVLISLLTSLFSNILFDIMTFLCFVAEIMTKFSTRFDAKAAKDAKGKGKVNPPSSLSHGGAESATVILASELRRHSLPGVPLWRERLLLLWELKREERFVRAKGHGSPKVRFTYSYSFHPSLCFTSSFFYFMFLECHVQLNL